jgi:hypothetical protein
MKYQVKENDGKWQAIISNPVLNLDRIYTYEEKEQAEYRIELEKQQVNEWLSTVPKLSDYFKPQN